MEIHIKTLTPLWTGGFEAGKVDRIHETGILGSLRWWMEVLVRGMGGKVCDPAEQECSVKDGLCEVCKIFGAEGQKRRFRLEVVQDNTQPDNTVTSKIQAERSNAKKGKPPTWYFPQDLKDKPRSGRFILQIQSLHPDFKPEILGGLIQFVADWSALGSRPQMGFGVIKIVDVDIDTKSILQSGRIPTQSLYNWLTAATKTKPDQALPSLRNIFLAKIQPQDSSKTFTEQDTFNLKYDLRQLFKAEQDIAQQKNQGNKPILKKDKEEELRHFIMGAAPDDKKGDKTEDDRMAAKIKISRFYPDDNSKFMRVWGWIPETAEVYSTTWNRESVIDKIYQHLNGKYTLQVWREMNSDRDKVTPNESSAQSFLCSLLNAKESSNIGK